LHGNLCLYNHQGHLQDGKEVAVKRLIPHFLGDKSGEAFMREVEVMSKLRHGNLLQLLFYCQERNERILVYEFMQNNSLNLYIFGTPLH
jgi:serine/threonine protein kinase